nr:hypothetical protein [Tanacetum cinerariifolium]
LAEDARVQPDVGLELVLGRGPLLGGLLLGELLAVVWELTVVADVALAAAARAYLVLTGVEEDVFAEYTEAGLMGGKTQHDQVGVEAVDDVGRVGVMGGHGAL